MAYPGIDKPQVIHSSEVSSDVGSRTKHGGHRALIHRSGKNHRISSKRGSPNPANRGLVVAVIRDTTSGA